jgi:hypothetical protein
MSTAITFAVFTESSPAVTVTCAVAHPGLPGDGYIGHVL